MLRGSEVLVDGDTPEANVEKQEDNNNTDFAHLVGPFRLPKLVRFAA